MRTTLTAAAGLLAACVAVATGQEFQQFASSAGKYKVQFPGPVKTETQDVPVGEEKLKLTLDTVELKGGTVFVVSFIDASDEAAKKPAGSRLDKVRDGNKGEKGKVIEEKDITVGMEKLPGRDILIETPRGFVRNRVVIAGKRLYQVMVLGTKEVVTSPSADKFVSSFEVTK